MCIIADIFLASPEQAEAYNGVEKDDTIERIELTNITELELAMLWSIIDQTEFDFDEHELEFIDDRDNAAIYRFSDSFIFLLSRLTKEDIAQFSSAWSDEQETQSPAEQSQHVLTELVNLARKALDRGKSIYLWSAL